MKNKENNHQLLVKECLLILSTILFTLWMVGFFMLKSGHGSSGYGQYKMNIISLIDSNGWSYILKDFGKPIDFEGFNYLGLGTIVLAILALPIIFRLVVDQRYQFDKRHLPLAFVFIALSIFAISHNIAFGPFQYTINLPEFIISLGNILHASGRMFWPVFYFLIWAILGLLIKGYKKNVLITLLLLSLIIQIADTSAGWRHKSNLPNFQWNSTLISKFWTLAPLYYKKIRVLPSQNAGPNWQVFGYYAASHKMSCNSAYLARVNNELVQTYNKKAAAAFIQGYYDMDTLYILDEKFTTLAMLGYHTGSSHLLTQIDNYSVLAPNWKQFNKEEWGHPLKGKSP